MKGGIEGFYFTEVFGKVMLKRSLQNRNVTL